MARPMKRVVQPIKEVVQEAVENSTNELVEWLENTVIDLIERVQELEKKLEKPIGKSINRIEAHTGEVASTVESYSGMKMDESDKVQSMVNAIKILPPNMVVEGRHLKENIEAICGFKVSDEMMDAAYVGIVHDYRGR